MEWCFLLGHLMCYGNEKVYPFILCLSIENTGRDKRASRAASRHHECLGCRKRLRKEMATKSDVRVRVPRRGHGEGGVSCAAVTGPWRFSISPCPASQSLAG